MKKVWTILLMCTVVSVIGVSQSAHADMIRLYPFNEAADPLTPGATEWTFEGNNDGYSHRSWFHVEGDAIYYEALSLLNPNTAQAVGIMEYYPGTNALGNIGPIDNELFAISALAADHPELKRGVSLASTGTIQGTIEFDTKMMGDGQYGQRILTFLQIAELTNAGDFRSYQLSMGNPGSDAGYWYLKVFEWDQSATAYGEVTANRKTFTLPSTDFDLDVWRTVRIQLETTDTATDPDTIRITIYVDGVQAMQLTEDFSNRVGTVDAYADADIAAAAFLPIHFKFQEGFSGQRKYIRNLKYFNGSPTSEPDVLPLTGTETETILGLGSVRAAAFAKETPYRRDATYPNALKPADRNGGIQIATVGGVGGFYWDGYTSNMLNYFSSTAEFDQVQFSPIYDGRQEGGLDKNWIAMSSSGANAKTYIYSVQTGNALQTAGLNGRFLTFSPTGDMVACAQWEDLLLYDSETGTLLRTIIGHSGEITSAAFSKDGQLIVTGSDDGTARLFNANSGLTYRTFIGHTEPVTDVAIYNSGTLSTPGTVNGTIVLTGSEDNSGKVWDYFGSGADTVYTLSGHTDDVLTVAIAPDSSKYMTGSTDKTAKIWTIVGGTPSAVDLTGHTAAVSGVVFSPTGDIVLSSSSEETMSWTVTGTAMYTYSGELLDTEDNFLRLLTIDRQTTKIWNTYQGESQDAMDGHSREITNAFYSKDEEYSFSITADGTGKLWGADDTDTATYGLEQSSVAATDAAFSPDNPTTSLLTGNKEGVAHLWSLTSMAPFFTMVHGGGAINAVDYSSDGERLVTGGEDGKAKVWDANNGDFIREFDHGSAISDVMFTNDRSLVITASPGGTTVKVWQYIDGTTLATINQVLLSISPDGKKLLTAGVDTESSNAYLYDLTNPSGTPLTLSGHTDIINVGIFSPDSSKIMTGSDDETIKTWDATTGSLSRTLTGHTRAVVALAFNTAGNTGVSGSEDGTARVWDLDTGFLSRTFSTHTSTVNSVAFTADEDYVLTGSDDGSSRYYSLTGAGSYLLSIVSDTNSFVAENTKKSFTVRMSEMSGVSAYKIVMLSTDLWGEILDDTATAPYNLTLANTACDGWTFDVHTETTAGGVAYPADWPNELGTTAGPWPLRMTIVTAHRGTNPPLPAGEGAIMKFSIDFPFVIQTSTTSPSMVQIVTKPDTETVATAGQNSKSFIDESPVSGRNITEGDLVEKWSSGALKDYEPFKVAWLGVTNAGQDYYFLWGDVSPATLDGVPGAGDAADILLYDALSLPGNLWDDGTTTAPAFPPAADVSGDGVVGAYDASLLIQYDAFMIDYFPADTDKDGYGPENSVVTKRLRNTAASSAQLLASVNDGNVVFSTDNAEGILSIRLVLDYNASQFAVAEDSVKLLVADALSQVYVNDQNGRLVISISLATALEAGPAELVSVKLNPIAPVTGDPELFSVDPELSRFNDGLIAIAPGSVSALTVSGSVPSSAPAVTPAPGTIVVGGGSSDASSDSSKSAAAYTFDAASDMMDVLAPGSGDFALGDVSIGAVSADEDDEEYTDGVGLVVELDAGEGATMLGDAVAADEYVFMRVSAKASSAAVSIGLGGLDASMNGSIGLTILNDPERVVGQYGYVDALCKSERGSIIPVLQVVNASDEAVTVELDNLSIYQVSADDISSAWMLE